MISSREQGITRLLHAAQSVMISGVFWFWYLLLFWVRQEPYPNGQTYAKYFIVVILAMIFEVLTRPQNLRLRFEQVRQINVSQSFRQTLWIVVAIFVLQVFSQDYRLSRVFVAGFIVICWTSFFLFNRNIELIFNSIFGRVFKKNKIRMIIMGPKEWCERLQLEMSSTLRFMSLVNVIIVEEDDGLEHRDLPREVAKTPVDLLVFSSDHIGEKTAMRLIEDGDRLGYRCWLPIEYTRRFGRHFSLERVGLLDVLTPPVEPLENLSNRAIKRAFDLLLSLAVCLTILPLCCVFVWILHRCFSPGPLFFKQERGGRNGLPFMVYKFRSLHVKNGSEVQQVSKSDDRIFKGGRLIRKTSIDEIPQFINVVLGNMSVVGPRPHMVEHDKEFAELYEKYGHRRFVKPGVTGLAQVKGFRGEIHKRVDLRHRATLDCFYVSRWNLGFDIKLILLTVLVIFFPPKSAY